MNFDFTGKIALVTGAGKGIGRCLSLKLAKLGAKVYALSRTDTDLQSLKKEMPSIETRCLDIGNWDKTRKVVEDIGRVDLLCNNAAIISDVPISQVTEEHVDEMYNVNFKAALNISQIVVKNITSRGGSGAIVNVSSIAGLYGSTMYPVYCTTKAAMDMLTKTMATELAPKKIRVNSCNPTGLMTPMGEKVYDTKEKYDSFVSRIPMGRMADPEEVVDTIIFLMSDYASMVSGVMLKVDGAQTVHL